MKSYIIIFAIKTALKGCSLRMVAATVSSFSISPVKWYLLQITPSFQLLAFVTHYYVWRRFLLLEIEKVPFFSMVTFHSNNFPDRMTITSNRIANSHTCTPLKWTAEMKRPHMLWAISALYTFIIRYCHHKSQWNRLFHSEIIHLVQILHIDWYFESGCRHSHAFKSKSHLVFLYTPSSIYNQFSQCWN